MDGTRGYGQVINPTQYRTYDIIRHDASKIYFFFHRCSCLLLTIADRRGLQQPLLHNTIPSQVYNKYTQLRIMDLLFYLFLFFGRVSGVGGNKNKKKKGGLLSVPGCHTQKDRHIHVTIQFLSLPQPTHTPLLVYFFFFF